MNIAKFMQAPMAAILRLRFRWNKWAVFFVLASTSALLSEVERCAPFPKSSAGRADTLAPRCVCSS